MVCAVPAYTYSFIDESCLVETVYPRKKDVPKGFLEVVVGDTRRQVESRRVEEVVSSGSIEHDLRLALEVCNLPKHDFTQLTGSCHFQHRTVKNPEFQFHYLSTTAHLTLCSFQIGRIRSYTNPKMLLILFHPRTISLLLPTRPLNLEHGRKVSYGAHERPFGTLPSWNSTMRMMWYPRSVKQVGL
jgi:hypothetical protein